MAYKTTVNKACATREVALAELWTQLAAMGWTSIDGNFTPIAAMAYTAVDATANTFTMSGTPPANGTPVQIKTTGTLPGGLSTLTQYYIVNGSGSTFKLATTYNGSAIDITTQGTGNHSIVESYRVYSSNGENSDKITEYIQISFFASATTIVSLGWYKWDASTHTGSGSTGSGIGAITTSQSGFYFWIHGNKNIVYITTKNVSTYTKMFFGHMKPFNTLVTALTGGVSSGSSVSLPVTSSAGFEVGYTYQIIGATLEGRDNVVVASIPDSTHLVVTTLARNYSSGSLIGLHPSTFGVLSANSFYPTCPIGVVGLANNSSGYSSLTVDLILWPGSIDPDYRTNKYVLFPIVAANEYDNPGSNTSIGMYMDEYLLNCASTSMTNEDTFAVTRQDSGTSTGSNSSTVLNDTGKAWTTNAFANKVIIITFGLGAGQIKKVASNTGTATTLASGWTFETVPDATSQYIICDEGYRYLNDANYGIYAVREAV